VYVGLDQDPWRHIGGDSRLNLTPQWKRYTVLLTANNPVANHNRLSFVLGESVGDVWLADFSSGAASWWNWSRGKRLKQATFR
jgi:hypothetical protein